MISKVFRKLNLSNQTEVLVVNAPASFEQDLATLDGVSITRNLRDSRQRGFAIAFATKQNELKNVGKIASNMKGDAIVWCAYPKKTSRNLTCEFDRDNGWSSLGGAGFEPVRQVAIDDDWTAVRFRRVEFIKSMTRAKERAITPAGKHRA